MDQAEDQSPSAPGRYDNRYVLLLAAIVAGVFPDCYANGLTPFKKVSEYIISVIFVAAALRLGREAKTFNPRVHALIRLSIIFTTLAE